MNNATLKKLTLVLAIMLVLRTSSLLRAQTFSAPLQATGPNSIDFEFRANGTLLAKGVGPDLSTWPYTPGTGTLLSADQGAGTRLLWYPALAAFRAGRLFNRPNAWDLGNIGMFSMATGLDTTASGYASTALGLSSTASGYASMASGLTSTASGTASTALGLSSTASGIASTALGLSSTASGYESTASGYGSTASGNASTASGYFATAIGFASTALGGGSTASGNESTALGLYSTASGYASTALGYGSTAQGMMSLASGYQTTASSYASFVIGSCNLGGGQPNTWVPTDPLFEIGNGRLGASSDALVVHKNGNMAVQGVITAAPGGDIPMYTGN